MCYCSFVEVPFTLLILDHCMQKHVLTIVLDTVFYNIHSKHTAYIERAWCKINE